MGRAKDPPPGRLALLERELARVRRQLATVGRRLASQDARLRDLVRSSEEQRRRQGIIYEALRFREPPRKGDRGVVQDLQTSVVRLEDYLLRTSERIDRILSALKQHREFLVSVNKRLLSAGTKDRIRLELDVMKNTVSILALNGVELDASIVQDIENLRKRLRETSDVAELEKAKADLDRRFDGELRKYDLDAIWAKKKEIPGYG